jgi:hypothetical protein
LTPYPPPGPPEVEHFLATLSTTAPSRRLQYVCFRVRNHHPAEITILREDKIDIRLYQKPLNRYHSLLFKSLHTRHTQISFITSDFLATCFETLRERNFSVRENFSTTAFEYGAVLHPLFPRMLGILTVLVSERIKDAATFCWCRS